MVRLRTRVGCLGLDLPFALGHPNIAQHKNRVFSIMVVEDSWILTLDDSNHQRKKYRKDGLGFEGVGTMMGITMMVACM
jgi:hypothetical protein